jgi:hypothetical protein
MTHLTDEQLLDAAEGLRPDAVIRHLGGCDRCEREVAGLKAALAEASAVEASDPSPLFWTHLSKRVRESIDAVPSDARGRGGWQRWAVAVPLGVAAGILAVLVSAPAWRGSAADMDAGLSAFPDLQVWTEPVDPPVDDPWADVLGALAADVDWDAAAEAGLSVRAESIDRLVFELTDEEREELRRLLHEELGTDGV